MKFDLLRLRKTLMWICLGVFIGLLYSGIQVPYSRFNVKSNSQFDVKSTKIGSPIPYSVTLRETYVAPNGATKDASEIIWAVRSDGSVLNQMTWKSPQEHSRRDIWFSSGEAITIIEPENLKQTKALKIPTARLQRDPESKCINSLLGTPMNSAPENILGEEWISGYKTVKVSTNDTTWWFAIDHGCAMVKSRMDFGAKGVSEKHLVSLIPGEPDTALFQIPSTAKENSPRQ